jgi:hypothetical protein
MPETGWVSGWVDFRGDAGRGFRANWRQRFSYALPPRLLSVAQMKKNIKALPFGVEQALMFFLSLDV